MEDLLTISVVTDQTRSWVYGRSGSGIFPVAEWREVFPEYNIQVTKEGKYYDQPFAIKYIRLWEGMDYGPYDSNVLTILHCMPGLVGPGFQFLNIIELGTDDHDHIQIEHVGMIEGC